MWSKKYIFFLLNEVDNKEIENSQVLKIEKDNFFALTSHKVNVYCRV